jgi:hypothetical protein
MQAGLMLYILAWDIQFFSLMKKRIALIVLSASLVFTQCKKPGCLESSGASTSIKRTVPAFTQIHLYDNINLILTQADEESVTVEAGKNIQPNISTVVDNGKLTIRNTGSCGWLRNPDEKINVYVTIKTIDWLFYDGSGSITATQAMSTPHLTIFTKEGAGDIDLDINANVISAHLEGTSLDVKLRGKIGHLESFVNSRGTIDFSGLETNSINMMYVSLRDGFINNNGSITVSIHHTGNLYYKGNPTTIKPTYLSSGRLIKSL